jgi:hypothetical protein
MTENSGGYAPPGKPPEQPGGYKPPEQPGDGKPPEQPGDDKCPDPSGPYTQYRVAAEIAKKKESLFTADATAVNDKYKRLAGAQQKYADAWAGQKKNWADLYCELKRIRDTLNNALDEATRKHLEDCWTSLSTETSEATQPVNCDDIAGIDCKKLLDDAMNLAPDKLADALVNWHRQADHAKDCADQDDQKFDDLAGFPDKLSDLISSLKTRAGKIDNDLGKPGNDPQRSYVEYLALHRDFCDLWRKIVTAAAYTCQLKYVFVQLLKSHQASICLQVAIHGGEQRMSFEDEAKQARADSVIDLVLECAQPAKPDDSTAPPGDCPPPSEQPKPGGYSPPGQQPDPGQEPKPGGYSPPGQQPDPGQEPKEGQYGTPQQQPQPGPTQSAGG